MLINKSEKHPEKAASAITESLETDSKTRLEILSHPAKHPPSKRSILAGIRTVEPVPK
jgi:hypothetical protein